MTGFHQRGARARAPGDRALTLVELLIVIVLVAIAATLAVRLTADATRLRAVARLLTADLAFAQIESITHADDCCVVIFDQANGSYTIARSSAPGTPITEPVTGQPYVTQYGSGRVAELAGVSIQGHSLDGDDRVEFGMFGQIDQTTAATITLQVGALSMTVRIDAASGGASITGGGS